ncbi:MAG: alkaline phosphatase family protein [Candidatus Freyarchaeota archaeon]
MHVKEFTDMPSSLRKNSRITNEPEGRIKSSYFITISTWKFLTGLILFLEKSGDGMKKIIVIGLDGATWEVLIPLVKKNKLPVLKKLLKYSAYGSLESTIPPVTGPSWLSFATGKNPGKLGVYDFLNKEGIDLRLKPVFSRHYRGQSVWDYFSRKGYKVGVVTYPTLYPPYAINGFMISGLAPIDGKITYPEKLRGEIDKVSGGFELVVDYHKPKYDNVELFLRDLNRVTDKQFRVVLHLLKTKDWNLFIYVCSATDWIQHIMWKHIDKSHPQYDQRVSPKYAEEFEKFFQKIDGFLAKLMNFDANLLIVSDHGFGPQDQCFNLVKWLKNKGYLLRKKIKTELGVKVKSKLLQTSTFLVRLFKLRKFFPHTLAIRVRRGLLTSIADVIDFDRSVAYCLGHTIPFGGIYINSNIKNSDKYEKIKMKIISDLKRLSNDIGRPLKVTIYEPEKIYNGDKIHLAPDVIFTINDWRCVILEKSFDRPLFEDKPYSNRHTGSHRLNGILLANGKDIKKGYKVEKAKIYDIASTIFHIFGLPIPKDMDGRVLMEIFEPDSEPAKRKPVYVDPSYYDKSEEDKLKSKIRELKLKGKI